jgi:hypothetical protein
MIIILYALSITSAEVDKEVVGRGGEWVGGVLLEISLGALSWKLLWELLWGTLLGNSLGNDLGKFSRENKFVNLIGNRCLGTLSANSLGELS